MTLDELLRSAPIDPLDARILAAHALQCSRVQLVIRARDALTDDEVQRIQTLLMRRQQGEPVAYLTGEREFYGLRFAVTPAVLIPRPETELLVELATERLPRGGRVLDLGTGSGAIAVTLAHLRPDAHITATDLSEEALDVARANATAHNVTVHFLHSDWYAALTGAFDLIVSNPPYIARDDRHLTQGDVRFEPRGALTDDANGLQALLKVINGAPAHLVAGGWLLQEHGYDQAAAVRDAMQMQGWTSIQSWRDLAGIERVSGAQSLS